MSAAAELAARAGRHSLVYGTGLALTIVTGMASLAVFTRLMAPAEYGKLAVLTAFSGLLTLLSTVGIVQGVLSVVFGGGGDDDDDGGDIDDENEPADSVGRKREALGTGLLLTTTTGSLATVIVWVLAAPLSDLLLSERDVGLVRLAGVVGGLGAVWRLVQTVPRLERRPSRYVLLEVSRPVLAVAIGVPFVVEGSGPRGVLLGLAASTALMLAFALVVARSTYRLAFEPAVLPIAVQRGAAFVPYGVSNFMIAHGGVFILSAGVSHAELGFYRVATTLGHVITYASSVFFMAWMPLKRTSLFAATRKERGHGWIGGKMTTWFAITALGLLVFIDVGARTLVRIAGPAYEEAADLIPIVGTAAAAHAAMLFAYRVATFPRKRLALGLLTSAGAVLFLGSAVLLVDEIGTKSVPVAAIGSYGLVAVAFVVLGQRSSRPVDFEWRRLAGTAAVAGVLIACDHLLATADGTVGVAIGAGLLLAYPALLLALRIVTPEDVRVVTGVARATLRPARSDRPELLARLRALPHEHRRTLCSALGPDRRGTAPDGEAVAAALRAFGNGAPEPDPTEHDQAVGRYLVSDLSRAERDAMARALLRRGVDPGELDRLEQTLEALRRLPAAAWRSYASGGWR